MIRDFVRSIPVFGTIARKVYHLYLKYRRFPGSAAYWERRYREGGSSGAGSYNHLAQFKAEILNRIVSESGALTVIEYGCGDGNQLKLASYADYTGFDVSAAAIDMCRRLFEGVPGRRFYLMDEYSGQRADVTLSLDVIYHLVEDHVYHAYMARLFDSSDRMVVIYSSDFDAPQNRHERRRKFTDWVSSERPDFALIEHVPNRYPWKGNHFEGSSADFFVYERIP